MYQTRRFEAVLPPVSVAAWPGLHSFGSSRAPLWKVLPGKRLLENTGVALGDPASPEMNALPRWLLLALFALLIVAPSESFLRQLLLRRRCGDSRRLAELPRAARAALLADPPLCARRSDGAGLSRYGCIAAYM